MSTKGNGKAVRWLRKHVDYQGDDCLKWAFFVTSFGYGQLGYLGKVHYAHRFMCELAHGPAPTSDHEAAHKCGKGHEACVNPRHLYWATPSQNRLDALRHGSTMPRSNKRTLTQEQVDQIKYLEGRMLKIDIAEKFGISPSRVWAICANKLYRNDGKMNHWTEDEDRQLRDAVRKGMSCQGISSVVAGRTMPAITRRIRRLGLSLRSGRTA